MKTQKQQKLTKYKQPILALLFILLAIPVQAVIITKSFTGLWLQPDHESQGFDFQVIDQNGMPQALTYWYTYDTEGNPMWLIGMGNITEETVSMDLMTVTGVTNLQNNNPADRNEVILATANFTFADCNNGTVEIVPSPINDDMTTNSISGTGGIIQIQRLTTIQGANCSGGISDNTSPGDNDEEYQQFMGNTGIYPDGNARFEFEQDRENSEFEVEVEDVPVGSYDLRVGGIIRSQIQVINMNSGTEGKVEFESPINDNNLLLDFDPRNKLIEILEGNTVLFTSDFTPTPGGNNPPASNGAPPFANDIETKVFFNNTGVIPSARGEVELEQEQNEVEFEVEIENLPLGNYSLFVGGVEKGIITVVNDDGGREGELEFRFPSEVGKPLLNFDPRGQLIEVRQNGNTILEVEFTTSTGGNNPPPGGNNNPGPSGAPPFANDIETTRFLNNTGVITSARGEVELEQEPNEVEFEVEIENVPLGNYTLFVDGVEKGIITVINDDDGTEGEIEFNYPQEFNKPLLDFDPRGKLIEVRQNGNTILEVLF
ncbi:MAG: hypothetical protein L3J53_00070 [Proteobacteria bacterium]|nr:hypothetical protein [Pseudomonadota bacterium]